MDERMSASYRGVQMWSVCCSTGEAVCVCVCVDEAAATERVQQFLHRAEGIAVGLVLVDPILYVHTHQKMVNY